MRFGRSYWIILFSFSCYSSSTVSPSMTRWNIPISHYPEMEANHSQLFRPLDVSAHQKVNDLTLCASWPLSRLIMGTWGGLFDLLRQEDSRVCWKSCDAFVSLIELLVISSSCLGQARWTMQAEHRYPCLFFNLLSLANCYEFLHRTHTDIIQHCECLHVFWPLLFKCFFSPQDPVSHTHLQYFALCKRRRTVLQCFRRLRWMRLVNFSTGS